MVKWFRGLPFESPVGMEPDETLRKSIELDLRWKITTNDIEHFQAETPKIEHYGGNDRGDSIFNALNKGEEPMLIKDMDELLHDVGNNYHNAEEMLLRGDLYAQG